MLSLRMHGALPPLSIHVTVWYLIKSRCQLTCTTKLRYLVDATDVYVRSHMTTAHAAVKSAFCMIESDFVYIFYAGY